MTFIEFQTLRSIRLVGQTGDRCYALGDTIVERQSIYNVAFVTDDPRVHHRQHRIALTAD
jgi:hypothetical protein